MAEVLVRREGLDFRALTEWEFIGLLREDLLKASEVCDAGYYVVEIDYTYTGTDSWRFIHVHKGEEPLVAELRRAWTSLRGSKNWKEGRGWEIVDGSVNVLFEPEVWARVKAARDKEAAEIAAYYGRGGGCYTGD